MEPGRVIVISVYQTRAIPQTQDGAINGFYIMVDIIFKLTRYRGCGLLCLLFLTVVGCAVSQPTRETLSPPTLPMPSAAEAALYLGLLPNQTDFSLAEIKCRVLLLEVFQSDCSLCRHQAGDLNDLYRALASEGLSPQVKIIGIGYGDDSFSVGEFARQFGISYPLFADPRGGCVPVEEIPLLFILVPAANGFSVVSEFHGRHPGTGKLMDLVRQELAN